MLMKVLWFRFYDRTNSNLKQLLNLIQPLATLNHDP